MSRFVNLIVIHCSASPDGASLFEGHSGEPGFRTPVEVIDGWHSERGFHRTEAWRAQMNPRLEAIGYHFIIYTSGTIATGRCMEEIGAHVAGWNKRSIGVCMIGAGHYTVHQWKSLRELITDLKLKYPSARVIGHRDLSPDADGDGTVEPSEWLKTCPLFDVADWLKRDMSPAPENVWAEPAKQVVA